MKLDSIPIMHAGDDALFEIYNKKEKELRERSLTDEDLLKFKEEVDDIRWYLDLRIRFENKGDQERDSFLSDIRDNPGRLDKLIKQYGWIEGEMNYLYTTVGIQLYVEQMERLYKSINSTHIKNNA